MKSSSGAVAAKIATMFVIPLQAGLAAWSLDDVYLGIAAAIVLCLAFPRSFLLAKWNRTREAIGNSRDARRWEFLLAVAAVPYSLGVGIIAFFAILNAGDSNWDLVEIAVAIGYASVFPVTVGLRPAIAAAHILLTIVPGALGCLWMGTMPHLVMAFMALFLVQVLLANARIVSEAVIGHIALRHEADLRAKQDPLTSLFNRRAFDEHFATLTERGAPFALVLCDLDGFKAVNDRFGHAAGDKLLTEIAKRLRSAVGDEDFMARLGGDEFAIVTTADGAATVAESLVVVCQLPVFHDGAVLRIGVSAGVATGTGETILRDADAALYAAKRAGRNCWRQAANADRRAA